MNNSNNFIGEKELNHFLEYERSKVWSYLRNAYSLSDDDIGDIYQESSLVLYRNIVGGKLANLTSALSTYFFRVCINQALVHIAKRKKTVPLVSDNIEVEEGTFLNDKLDELYLLATEDNSDEYRTQADRIVDEIVQSLPETCKNIFEGYYWQNLTTKVIADMFGYANANTVKAQKYKCVDKFKKRYNELVKKYYD